MFKNFAENSTQGFAIGDLNGKIHYINPALAKIVGINSINPEKRKSFAEFYMKSDRKKLLGEILDSIKNNGSWSGELELKSHEGKKIPTYQSYFLLDDEFGNPMYIADIIIDMTERKKIDKELEKYRENLEDLVNERNKKLSN